MAEVSGRRSWSVKSIHNGTIEEDVKIHTTSKIRGKTGPHTSQPCCEQFIYKSAGWLVVQFKRVSLEPIKLTVVIMSSLRVEPPLSEGVGYGVVVGLGVVFAVCKTRHVMFLLPTLTYEGMIWVTRALKKSFGEDNNTTET
jgi:hypothetical protein